MEEVPLNKHISITVHTTSITELRTRTWKTFFFTVKLQTESNGCVAVTVRHITVVQF